MKAKEIALSILRSLLTALGAYLIGDNFLGVEINNEVWLGWLGVIITLGSTIWGIFDKTATTEMIESGLRSFIIAGGELLVGAGYIKAEVVNSLLMILSVLVPVIWSQASKVKNKNIATGETRIADLSGVDPQKVPIAPDTTPSKTKK